MSDLTRIPHDELQQVVNQLEQGLYNHQQWHNALIRTLICRLPPDKHDVVPEAHKECRFGQWYYSQHPEIIATHAGFVAIGTAHKNMHEMARHLLEDASNMISIPPQEYDHFANAIEQLRLEIYSLKNEVTDLLYNHDTLTGAINRVNMPHILREQQELAKRQGECCCLAFIDLDFFKKVNDTYSHQAGDLVLSTVANYIMQNLRPYDKLFRLGGEEFLICFPFTKLAEGYDILERIRKEIANLEINIKPNEAIHITVSIGLVLLDLNSSVERSIEYADRAMYSAKSSGRNCVKILEGE